MQVTSAHQAAIAEAHRALAERQFQRAHRLAMGVLQENPQAAEAYFVMALIAHRHENVAKAEEIVGRALRFDPEKPDYLLFRAQCLLELSRHEEAREIAARLDSISLESAHQNDTLGVLLSRLGWHERALDRFRRACALRPDDVNFQYNLASCLQFSGLFGEAEAAYEKAIYLQPAHFRSHSSLSQLRRQTEQHNHLERLLSLWQTLGDDVDARLHIGHALAKEYEDLGNYERAMHYLEEAKRQKAIQVSQEEQEGRQLFAAAQQLSSRLGDLQHAGWPSEEPIFIVGMPRTGTTLVERMLSSHSQVESAGELANFSLLVKQQLGTASPWVLDVETIDRADELDFQRLGKDYLASTRHLTGTSAHFIDKMPLNFMYVPLIARALPGASIICLRRNPMDTCLSNFRQLFSTGFSYYNYAYSLRDTAEFYARFHSLMEHYAAVMGERFYQLRYEDLVDDPESQCRALLGYCGLQWEPQCLEFQDNRAPVATASSVQVREPLYTRAVQRWRHYEPWLGEARAVLERDGIEYC